MSPDIWDEQMKLRPDVRDQLLVIAQEFVDWLEVDVPVVDVYFTGSLANFNWSKFSDIDLHPVMELSTVDQDVELLKDLLMAKKTIWNDKYDVMVKGYEVELYPQDISETHHSTGVYSLMKDEWVVRPEYEKPFIDLNAVIEKANALIELIDAAVRGSDCSSECLGMVKQRIKDMRSAGLEEGGEYSVENLAFKLLRRNGYIEKLYDTAEARYERELSLESHIVESDVKPAYRYVHFTDEQHANDIVESGFIDQSASGGRAVYAVMVGGEYVPSTQRTKLGRARNRDWAVVFETDLLPDLAFPEEVLWHVKRLPIMNAHVVKADAAARLLDGTIPVDDDDMLMIDMQASNVDWDSGMRMREVHECDYT